MYWKENKWMGILAGVMFLICLSLTAAFFIQKRRIHKKAEQEFKDWRNTRAERYILDEEGHPIGVKRIR